MKNKKIILTIIGMAVYLAGFSQKDDRPSWLRDGVPNSDYYDYYVGIGDDENVQNAHENAVIDVKKQISEYIEANYTIDSDAGIKISNEEGDTIRSTTKYDLVVTIKQKGKLIKLTGIKEVEIYQTGKKFYSFYRVPKKDVDIPFKKEKFYVKDNSHKWKSAIFPGWGQMTVGKKSRGALLLIGGGIFATGIVTSQTLCSINQNNYTSAVKRGDITNANIYKSNRDNWGTIRNISIVGFGSLYILNLIDAFSTKGNKIYSFNNKRFRLYPAASSKSVGMGISLKLN
jgi:hypothetical protein